MENIIWKSIKHYAKNYEVSNLGDVKSIKFGRVKILNPSKNRGGYLQVILCLKGIQKTRRIHQLVAESFLNYKKENTENLVVNHKDFNRTNNSLENLEIISRRENTNKKHIKSSSQYTGVYLEKSTNKWRACISINKKSIKLGCFTNEKEASEYYENALKNHLSGLPVEVKKPNLSSKYKGVCWSKSNNKWMSRIMIDGYAKHLGQFDTEIEAHNIYQIEINKN